MGARSSKTIPPNSPLGQLLESLKPHALIPSIKLTTLTRLCSKTWPRYKLQGDLRWPSQGSFDPDILRELANFCHRSAKWKEMMYIMAFFYMALKTDPSASSQCSPAHMFLAMSSPQGPSASAMDPADEPPPLWPRGTTPSRQGDTSQVSNFYTPRSLGVPREPAPHDASNRSTLRPPEVRRKHFSKSRSPSPKSSRSSPRKHSSRSLSPRSSDSSLSSPDSASPHSPRSRKQRKQLKVSFRYR